MAALSGSIGSHYRRFEWLALRNKKAFAAEELLGAGIAIPDPEEFELAEATLEGALSTQRWAAEQQELETPTLARFEAALAERLACGLAVAIQQSSSAEIQALCHLFNVVGGILPHLHDANRFLAAVTFLARVNAGRGDPKTVVSRIELLGGRIGRSFAHVRDELGDQLCPPQIATGAITATAWCGLASPDVSGHEMIDRTVGFYISLLGEVVTIVRAAEASTLQTAAKPE